MYNYTNILKLHVCVQKAVHFLKFECWNAALYVHVLACIVVNVVFGKVTSGIRS